jgi:hypothetical protein
MMNVPTSEPSVRRFAAAVVVLLCLSIVSVAATGAVGAQGTANISIQPAESNLTVGEAAQFQVVVEGAENGVAGYSLDVTVSDPAVAEITGVNVTKDPPFSIAEITDDGAGVSFEVAMGETAHDAAEAVVVATFTVNGTTAGESATLSPAANITIAGQEDGTTTRYSVGAVGNASFDVVASTPDDDGGTGDDSTGDDGGTGDDSTGDDGGTGDDSTGDGGTDDDSTGDGGTDDDSAGDDSEDGSGPGFGIVGVVGVLLGAGALLARAGPDERAAGKN